MTADAWGIPHVSAASMPEVAREQGRGVVADRMWQITLARLKSEGRTATVLGPRGVPWDRVARQVELPRLARQAYDGLAPESAGFVSAYVEGVNEALRTARPATELRETGHTPEPWQPWTPLGIFAAHHLLFATLPRKLWRRHLNDTVGAELASLLEHEGPGDHPGSETVRGSGSNSWAVGGARAAGGLPIIGGDPHRAFEWPNSYQQVRLTCTDPDDSFDVVGLTFPGVPGVQHFAHAGEVAWGITNATADYQDVFVEDIERREEGLYARTVEGRQRLVVSTETVEVAGGPDEHVEVIRTPLGHVVHGSPHQPGETGGPVLSVRTAAGALTDLGFDALVPLLRARTVADVEAAMDRWVEPVNNLLVADTRGTVHHRVVGRVPVRHETNRHLPVPAWRPEHHWTGWVTDLPGIDVPPDGQVVTANHRMSDDFDRIGVDFAPPARADRIDGLLRGRSGLALADFAAVHRDVLAGQPAALHAALGRLTGLSGAAERLRRRLVEWDQRFTPDSRRATAYVAVRSRFVAALAELPVFAGIDDHDYNRVFAAWFDLPTELYLSLAAVLSEHGRRLLPEVDRVLAEAVRAEAESVPEVGDERTGEVGHAPWGDRHRFAPYHPLRGDLPGAPGLGGDNDCVHCSGSRPGCDLALRGSVARYVWDLAGWDRSGWVVPLGASGDEASPHHRDQLETWRSGLLLPLA